jgi:tetratricopeptide (TPR) repeat protein
MSIIIGAYFFQTPSYLIGVTNPSQTNDLFSSTTPTQSSIDNIAASALANGTTAQQKSDMTDAIKDYKITIALSPQSDNAVTAYQLLAGIYQTQGNNTAAIAVLKKAEAAFPQSDTMETALGDIYYSQKDYANAEKEYSKAVMTNPSNSSDHYSLGQAYMAEGKYSAAETQIKTAIRLSPTSADGYFALGQLYHKEGKMSDAITQLNKALRIAPSDTNSLLELGEVYADKNDTKNANKMLAKLTNLASTSASTSNTASAVTLLQAYITKAALPAITSSSSSSGFNAKMGPNVNLSSMDAALTAPNSTDTLSMQFTFSKDMDPTSVQNPSNWQISKSNTTCIGGAYNYGVSSPTDTSIAQTPTSVTYDSKTKTATVKFRMTQNSSGTGTIDPEHIQFQFNGKDTSGNAMDTSANAYSGISQIV